MARVATVVEATSQPMARRDPLRKHMDLIYQEVSALSSHEASEREESSVRLPLLSRNVALQEHQCGGGLVAYRVCAHAGMLATLYL